MKLLRTSLLLTLVGLFAISMQSCKTKKVIVKAPAPAERPAPAPEQKKMDEAPVKREPEPAPVEEKADLDVKNVHFEFNSEVLKTASFDVLDRLAKELKKAPSATLLLNGHSSIEGSAAHNMSLSVDRANSVKQYLVNAGISASRLKIKGYGATKPAASNSTEQGKALNRRVEFNVINP